MRAVEVIIVLLVWIILLSAFTALINTYKVINETINREKMRLFELKKRGEIAFSCKLPGTDIGHACPVGR